MKIKSVIKQSFVSSKNELNDGRRLAMHTNSHTHTYTAHTYTKPHINNSLLPHITFCH